jgi:hypothetical protein
VDLNSVQQKTANLTRRRTFYLGKTIKNEERHFGVVVTSSRDYIFTRVLSVEYGEE